MQIAAVKDDAPLRAGLYHLIHVGKPGANGLFGGYPAHARLRRGNHGVLDELAGKHGNGTIGDLAEALVHRLGVLIPRLHTESLAHGIPPRVVVLGNGDDLSAFEQAIELSVL